MATFGSVNNSTTLNRTLTFPASSLKKGATAPTDQTIGSSPGIGALRFSAETEIASSYITFVDDVDKTQNMRIDIEWCLVSGQTNGDPCDWTVEYVCPIENSTGNGPGKASTQLTATTTVTTGNGLAAGDLYRTQLTVTAADATNPTTNAMGIGMELHLTDTTGVASVDVISVHLHYVAKY